VTVGPSAAAAAYQAIAKMGAESATTGVSAGAGNDFSQFLSQAMNSAVSTMKQGEQVAASQVTGQADVVNVVNAVNSAELTLDTVVAVRDKVLSAYQNIMQMPI
jgi:flagellar hook-basal body complex protein FliE